MRKRGHEFQREQGREYEELREERKGRNVIKLQSQKLTKSYAYIQWSVNHFKHPGKHI